MTKKLVDGVLVDLTLEEIAEIELRNIRTPEQLLSEAKAARQVEVYAIKVTTAAGNVFDGDERSQDRMATTLAAMDDTDTGPWVLADNSIITVTKAELREALHLARAKMGEIWVRPYLIREL